MGYDQDAWARIFDYHARPLEPALSVVEAVRAHTTALLRTLPDDAWSRAGRHSESGTYSMEAWLRIYSDHLEGHARQIERNLDAWRAGTRPPPIAEGQSTQPTAVNLTSHLERRTRQPSSPSVHRSEPGDAPEFATGASATAPMTRCGMPLAPADPRNPRDP